MDKVEGIGELGHAGCKHLFTDITSKKEINFLIYEEGVNDNTYPAENTR